MLTTFSPFSSSSPPSFLPDGGISNRLLCLRDSETCRATVTSIGDNELFVVSIVEVGLGVTMLSPGLVPRLLLLLLGCAGMAFELLFDSGVVFTCASSLTGAACHLVARAADACSCVRGTVTARRGWGEADREAGSVLK